MSRRPTIGFVAAFVVLAGACLGDCAEPPPAAKPAQAGVPAAPAAGKQAPTKEECRQFADSLVKAVQAGDVAQFNQLIDWDAVLERTTAGIAAPAQCRRDFASGVKIGCFAENSLAARLAAEIRAGGSYRFLHVRDQGGERRCLFRLLNNEGGLNYHDCFLVRQPDGKVRAADILFLITGEPLSQTLRRSYVELAAESSKSALAKLTQGESDLVKNARTMQQMARHLQGGKLQEVVRLFERSPESLKKDKIARLMWLSAIRGLDEDRYDLGMEEFRKSFPGDPCLDLVTLDSHFIHKRYVELHAALDRIEKSVGGDPYLNVLRANTCLLEKRYAEARQFARKASDAEKDLEPAYACQLTISLHDKDYAETTRLLTFLERELHVPIGDLTTNPLYAEYVKSPQYAAFAKRK